MASDGKAFNFGDLRMYVTSPKSCLAKHPNPKSVLFCDEFISLTEIAQDTGLTVSFLSMLFARKRLPSVPTATKIACALGMELGEFFKGLGIH
jgi:hypothetical protein